VVLRQEPLHARNGQHGAQEGCRNAALEQAVAVLGEGRGIPHRVVDAETDEPAEQEIEVQLLHQLALGPHGVERLQQHRPQQLLGRDRGAADLRVDRAEAPIQRRQSLVHQSPDRTQRMIRANTLLQIHVGKQRAAPAILSPHLTPSR